MSQPQNIDGVFASGTLNYEHPEDRLARIENEKAATETKRKMQWWSFCFRRTLVSGVLIFVIILTICMFLYLWKVEMSEQLKSTLLTGLFSICSGLTTGVLGFVAGKNLD